MKTLKQFFLPQDHPNPLANKRAVTGIALATFGVLLLFLRYPISQLAKSLGQSEWLYVYAVDMACMCFMLYGIGFLIRAYNGNWWKLHFFMDACASFCLYDIIERLFVSCEGSFRNEDWLNIGLIVAIFYFKQFKILNKLLGIK